MKPLQGVRRCWKQPAWVPKSKIHTMPGLVMVTYCECASTQRVQRKADGSVGTRGQKQEGWDHERRSFRLVCIHVRFIQPFGLSCCVCKCCTNMLAMVTAWARIVKMYTRPDFNSTYLSLCNSVFEQSLNLYSLISCIGHQMFGVKDWVYFIHLLTG